MQTSGSTAEPGHRAEPRAWWRSRRLAPGYALVIAFLVTALIGWLLSEPAPRSVDLRLVTANRSPATGLANARVEVLDGDGSDLAVDAGGRIHLTSSGKPLTVCVQLPKGWSAPQPAEQLGDFACWPLDDGDQADLVVTPPGTGR